MVDRLNDRNDQYDEDLKFLQESVDSVRQDAPPEAWCQSARQALHDSLQSETKERWFMKLFNGRQHGSMKWAVAVTAAVIIIGTVLMVPRFGGSSVAYADIAAKFRNAHTVIYTSIAHVKGQTVDSYKVYKRPNGIRTEYKGYYQVTDTKQGIVITVRPDEKHCLISRAEPLEMPNPLENLGNLPARATENMGRKEINGRQVEGFRVSPGGTDITLWADVKTGDPVKVEFASPNTSAIFEFTDFQIDTPLADSLFDVTPPPGFSSENVKDESSRVPTEQDLIIFLRTWAMHSRHQDGQFPPCLDPMDTKMNTELRVMEVPAEKGKFGEAMKTNGQVWDWWQFIGNMQSESDWHYAGRGVKLGDAKTPIFWYKPKGSKLYRVIMGDLSVISDVDLGQGPTGPNITLPKNL